MKFEEPVWRTTTTYGHGSWALFAGECENHQHPEATSLKRSRHPVKVEEPVWVTPHQAAGDETIDPIYSLNR